MGSDIFALAILALGCQNQIEPEAISLLGEQLFPIELPEDTREEYQANLKKAQADYQSDPNDADHIIWLGRRTAYLWRYREAVKIYTGGIEKYPNDPRFYRHRGHRYITLREFDKAIDDLQKAVELISGKPDGVEPDGLPNKFSIPTSTLHSNIWYHLGLAYYLKGDFENALKAYLQCMKYSNNADLLCATSDWLYMTYRRLGQHRKAAEVLMPIEPDMKILENFAYHKRLMMYKGQVPGDSLLNVQDASELELATQGYGLDNFYFYSGSKKEGIAIFRKVLEGSHWAAFGYIAAEAEIARLE